MKTKILALLMILLLILSCVSFATEDVSTIGAEDETATEVEDRENVGFDVMYEDFGDDIDRPKFEAEGDIEDDLYSISDNVTVSQNVSGNVYLMGDTVIIKGVTIDGNVFVCGRNVVFDGPEITGSVYVAGESVTLNNETDIYYDAYIIGEIVKLEKGSWIERNAKIGGENIVINGLIDNNAFISSENIQIGENTKIGGKLEYEAKNQASIPTKASIGSVKFNKIEEKVKETTNKFVNMSKYMSLLGFILKVIVVYGFILLIKRNSEISSKKVY